jgi:hypothetical protein
VRRLGVLAPDLVAVAEPEPVGNPALTGSLPFAYDQQEISAAAAERGRAMRGDDRSNGQAGSCPPAELTEPSRRLRSVVTTILILDPNPP